MTTISKILRKNHSLRQHFQQSGLRFAVAATLTFLGLGAATDQAQAQAPPPAPATNSGAKPLFDGKSFEGWEGDLKYFRVENGTIIAGNLDDRVPQNEFLSTTREYRDFELRLDARLTDGEGNGGIQFRSHRAENSREMIGYQADCDVNHWGGVYDESRRRNFLGTRLNPAATKKALKPAGWNSYVIRCEGPRVRVWLNKVLTLDYTETDSSIPRSGHIALQIHSGAPAEVSYRNIRIEELPTSQP